MLRSALLHCCSAASDNKEAELNVFRTEPVSTLGGRSVEGGVSMASPAAVKPCLKCFGTEIKARVTCTGCEDYICAHCHWCEECADHQIRKCGACDKVSCDQCVDAGFCEGCEVLYCEGCRDVVSCTSANCGKKLCLTYEGDKYASCAVVCCNSVCQEALCTACATACALCHGVMCKHCSTACPGCDLKFCDGCECFAENCDTEDCG
eukprot:3148-Heterococcus_DN1.PRE.1